MSDPIETTTAATVDASVSTETTTAASADTATTATTSETTEQAETAGTTTTASEAEATTSEATTATETTATMHVVYVGPRLRKPFPLTPKTIFRQALPKPLAAAVAADADLAALFVPVSEFGAALTALKRPATVLSRSLTAVTARYIQTKGA